MALNTEADVCFDATYDMADVIKNEEGLFKAKKLGSPSAAFLDMASGC